MESEERYILAIELVIMTITLLINILQSVKIHKIRLNCSSCCSLNLDEDKESSQDKNP